jgi:diguanylate cyclase (GGDEF)-like protein
VENNKPDSTVGAVAKASAEAWLSREAISDALDIALEVFTSGSGEVEATLSSGIFPIAEAFGADVVVVYELLTEAKPQAFGQVYRWARAAGGTTPIDKELRLAANNPAIEKWLTILNADECVNLAYGDMESAEAAIASRFDLKVLALAPVFMSGTIWGAVVFGDTHKERRFDCLPQLRSAARLIANHIVMSEKRRAAEEAFLAFRKESDSTLAIMKNILNGLDAMIYVTVPHTGEILFINENMKRHYGIESVGPGDICYKVLQEGMDDRCEFCPCHQLDKKPNKPVVWVEHSTLTKRVYRNTDCYIEWPGGSLVHLQHSVDITETMHLQESLEKMLNSMDVNIFVSDLETDEILFVNKKMQTVFTSGADVKGEKCWKAFQGESARCSYCQKGKLMQNQKELVVWEEHNLALGKVFSNIDRVIPWPDGRSVHFQQCLDITETKRAHEDLKRREQVTKALNVAALEFLAQGGGSYEDSLREGMRAIADCVDVHRIYIWKHDKTQEKGLHFDNKFEWLDGEEEHQNLALNAKGLVFDPNHLWGKEDFFQGKCIYGPISKLPPGEREAMEAYGIKSLMLMPVYSQGHFWGFVSFDDCETERYFTEDEIDILRSASFMMVNVFQSIEYIEQVNTAHRHTELMLDAMPLCSIMMNKHLEAIGCNEAAVRLFEVSSKQELMRIFRNLSPAFQPDGQSSLEKTRAFLKKAFEEGSFIFDWMHQLPDGTPLPVEITLNRVAHDDYYAVVACATDLRNIREMENNIRMLEKEAEKVYIDPLTGIFNRRYLDENLARLIKTLARSGTVITLMMIDIDFFKSFNDTYGHAEGDRCLTDVAKTLSKSLSRETDFVARYGGEEFATVLPYTDAEGAQAIAEKLLENVRGRNIPHEKNQPSGHVTISIGTVTGTPEHEQGGEDYIKQADDMLYLAKRGGRDRCMFATLKTIEH